MVLEAGQSSDGTSQTKARTVPSRKETCQSSSGQVSLASWKGQSRVGKGQSSVGVCQAIHGTGQSSVGTGQSRITCQYIGAPGQVSLAQERPVQCCGLVNLAFGLHGQSRITCRYTAASGQVSLAPRRSSLVSRRGRSVYILVGQKLEASLVKIEEDLRDRSRMGKNAAICILKNARRSKKHRKKQGITLRI